MICGAIFAAFCLTSPLTYDGDTIKDEAPWGWQRYRLHGVYADELNHGLGNEAQLYLASLIGLQDIACDPVAPPSFDRFVVECWTADGRSLNCLMIASPYAHEDVRYSRGRYEACAE